jgi:hypothetical protein
MREQTLRKDADKAHITECKRKLSVMLEQKKDLSGCFDRLIEDYIAGKRDIKMYYQFKMYNDPKTNPWMDK